VNLANEFQGVKVWQAKLHSDSRGDFIKAYDVKARRIIGFEPEFKEVFSSLTLKGGIRGMHLQTGDHANFRLIYVTLGAAQDVLIDLRQESSTYGKYIAREISAKNGMCIFIPPGVAHGFQALDTCVMQYVTTTDYSQVHDTGVNPLTFGYNWPLRVSSLSERDLQLPSLAEWSFCE
jgi:dTDP-4-dehydrorhamnose 3,5-epimerase